MDKLRGVPAKQLDDVELSRATLACFEELDKVRSRSDELREERKRREVKARSRLDEAARGPTRGGAVNVRHMKVQLEQVEPSESPVYATVGGRRYELASMCTDRRGGLELEFDLPKSGPGEAP